MSRERDLLVSCLDEFQYHEVPCSDLIRTIKWLLNEPEQFETEQEVILRGNIKRFNEGLKVGQEAGNKAILEAAEAKQSYLDENERLTTLLLSAEDKIQELLAQPEQEQEQEPDYYLWHDEFHEQHPTNEGDPDVYPLYTHPPKREPLSEDEIVALWANKSPANEFECVRLVEKAHGIGVGE